MRAEKIEHLPASAQEWADLYKLAVLHRVDTLLVHQLRKKDLIKFAPPRQAKRWSAQLMQNSVTNLGLYSELEKISQTLSPHNIKIIALKGLFLADKVYKNIGIRRMSDIDILIPNGRIESAYRLLVDQLGYTVHGEKALSLNKGGHIAPLVSSTGIIIELHWTIMLDDDTPQDVIERSVPVKLVKANVHALSAEDNLLYLCKHIAHTHRFGYGGLRAICDIAWAIDFYAAELNWNSLLERTQRWGWSRIIYLALATARTLVSANVPDSTLTALSAHPDRDAMLAVAIGQLFSTETTGHDPVSDNISAFAQERGLKNKIVKLFQAVFIPREKLAQINQFDANSWRVSWLYIPRLFNLLRQHSGTLLRLSAGDEDMNSVAARRNALAKWMDGDKK